MSTSGSGAGSSRRASTGSRSSTTAASPASRPSCATAGSTSSHGSTTRACYAAWPESRSWARSSCCTRRTPRSSLRSPKRRSGRGGASARDFTSSRPAVAELEAIDRALFFAGETGCPVHIVHVSTARGVALVEQARRDGVDATCETCPHYLLFTEDDLDRLGVAAKCAPPLRTAEDRDELWRLLAGGSVLFVASDHSPSSPDLKEGDDFFAVWGGISGCQSTLGLILEHGYIRRSLPLETVASITSGGAAARFPLAGKRGLEPGSDADLALVDLGEAWTLQADELLYRHPLSPYVGETVRGRIVRTVVRGRTVYRDGRIVGEPSGRFVGRR